MNIDFGNKEINDLFNEMSIRYRKMVAKKLKSDIKNIEFSSSTIMSHSEEKVEEVPPIKNEGTDVEKIKELALKYLEEEQKRDRDYLYRSFLYEFLDEFSWMSIVNDCNSEIHGGDGWQSLHFSFCPRRPDYIVCPKKTVSIEVCTNMKGNTSTLYVAFDGTSYQLYHGEVGLEDMIVQNWDSFINAVEIYYDKI